MPHEQLLALAILAFCRLLHAGTQQHDIMCAWGSEYLEVGLGLGLSALRIAGHAHTVVEKYQRVIDLFHERHPTPPSSLQIVKADIFDFAQTLAPESLDGIFFDPYLSKDVPYDMQQLRDEVLPAFVRALRVGGAFVPYLSPSPSCVGPTTTILTALSSSGTRTRPTAGRNARPGNQGMLLFSAS